MACGRSATWAWTWRCCRWPDGGRRWGPGTWTRGLRPRPRHGCDRGSRSRSTGGRSAQWGWPTPATRRRASSPPASPSWRPACAWCSWRRASPATSSCGAPGGRDGSAACLSSGPAMVAIQVDTLTKRYGEHVAVDGISFSVHEGEAFGILGPNGAGKTTTLEMIEGLRKPDAGDIEVLGMPVWPDPMPVQARIGVQLQSTALFDRLSARELLELFARFDASDDPAGRARRALGLVGLESKQDDYAARMSGGQQQRLAIALALVHDPDVVFLDEPTTGLDPQARRNLWEVIRTIH